MAGTIVYVDIEHDLPAGLARELGGLGFRLRHTVDPNEALALVRDGATRLVMTMKENKKTNLCLFETVFVIN